MVFVTQDFLHTEATVHFFFSGPFTWNFLVMVFVTQDFLHTEATVNFLLLTMLSHFLSLAHFLQFFFSGFDFSVFVSYFEFLFTTDLGVRTGFRRGGRGRGFRWGVRGGRAAFVTGLTTPRRHCKIFVIDHAVTFIKLGPLIAILFSFFRFVFYLEFIFLGVRHTGLRTHRSNCIRLVFDKAVTFLELGPTLAILFSG